MQYQCQEKIEIICTKCNKRFKGSLKRKICDKCRSSNYFAKPVLKKRIGKTYQEILAEAKPIRKSDYNYRKIKDISNLNNHQPQQYCQFGHLFYIP